MIYNFPRSLLSKQQRPGLEVTEVNREVLKLDPSKLIEQPTNQNPKKQNII